MKVKSQAERINLMTAPAQKSRLEPKKAIIIRDKKYFQKK